LIKDMKEIYICGCLFLVLIFLSVEGMEAHAASVVLRLSACSASLQAGSLVYQLFI